MLTKGIELISSMKKAVKTKDIRRNPSRESMEITIKTLELLRLIQQLNEAKCHLQIILISIIQE